MKSKLQIDPWLLGPVSVLVIISLTTLFSINIVYFKSQLLSLFIGIIAFFFFSKVNVEFLKNLKIPIYIVSIILLLIILFIGYESHGAIRWIDILGVRLQFSEILKPFLAFSFAAQITEDNDPNLKSFLINILLIFPVLFLIFKQPDLGNALVYGSVSILTFVISGFPLYWFGLLFLPVLILSPAFWFSLHDYQRERVLTFLHTNSDPLGASYNGIQAIIAVGSGFFFGKGISEGTQSVLKFLPERHTDFIFATIAEGLGFVGAGIVIVAFLLLTFRIYKIFTEIDDPFSKTFLAACFGFIFIQGFVNIAMNLGLLPIVGITLPFVSFGGSSLLSNFIFLGIISAIAGSQKNKDVLEIR